MRLPDLHLLVRTWLLARLQVSAAGSSDLSTHAGNRELRHRSASRLASGVLAWIQCDFTEAFRPDRHLTDESRKEQIVGCRLPVYAALPLLQPPYLQS